MWILNRTFLSDPALSVFGSFLYLLYFLNKPFSFIPNTWCFRNTELRAFIQCNLIRSWPREKGKRTWLIHIVYCNVPWYRSWLVLKREIFGNKKAPYVLSMRLKLLVGRISFGDGLRQPFPTKRKLCNHCFVSSQFLQTISIILRYYWQSREILFIFKYQIFFISMLF